MSWLAPLLCQLSAICAIGALADFRSWVTESAQKQAAGDLGESRVSNVLTEMQDLEHFDNLIFLQGGKSVQIDHVVRGIDRLYVLETKNWRGLLHGGVDQQEWTLTRRNGGAVMHYNPLLQNARHVQALTDVTGVPVEGLVVMTNHVEHVSGKLPWGIIRLKRLKIVLGGKARNPQPPPSANSEEMEVAWGAIERIVYDGRRRHLMRSHVSRIYDKYVAKPWRIWIVLSLVLSGASMLLSGY